MKLLEPPPSASRAAIRRHGALVLLLGLVLVIAGAALPFAIDRSAHGALLDPSLRDRVRGAAWVAARLRFVAGVPMLVGLLAIVVGAWRAAVGRRPDEEPRTLGAAILRLSFATLVASAIVSAIAGAIVTATSNHP